MKSVRPCGSMTGEGAGCVVCFLLVTALNRITDFEGVLGFFYGAVLIAYGMCTLKGRPQDFVAAGLLWGLITIIGIYGIFSVMGILTENSLGEMLQQGGAGCPVLYAEKGEI